MTSIADGSVKIQMTSESNTSTPAWFGEIVVLSSSLQKYQVLTRINEQVRFARKRFGQYEIIDFLAVQIALRDQRRAHHGGVLRATSAFCHPERARSLSGIGCRLVQRSRGF